jgi:hypothetical protein
MLKFLFGVLTGLFIKEVAAYLPTIARWQINRGVKQLPEEMRADFGGKWFAVEAKLPGDLSKLIWGIGCNWLLAPQALKPATPEAAAKLLHFVFFVAYLRTVLDAIKLRFASPRQMRSRWLMLKLIADQAVAVDDPNRPQPLLVLADLVQDEKAKRALLAMVEAMRTAVQASKDKASEPTPTAASG